MDSAGTRQEPDHPSRSLGQTPHSGATQRCALARSPPVLSLDPAYYHSNNQVFIVVAAHVLENSGSDRKDHASNSNPMGGELNFQQPPRMSPFRGSRGPTGTLEHL